VLDSRAINGDFKHYYKLSHHKFRLIGEIHERKGEKERKGDDEIDPFLISLSLSLSLSLSIHRKRIEE